MEDFLDDIGAEVGVNPDEVEVVKKKKPKKTRLLRKDEKKALLDMLSDLASNSSDVVSTSSPKKIISTCTRNERDFGAHCKVPNR